MYPLETIAAYPRSQWYVAGYGSEFGSTTFGRRIFGEPIVFFRDAAGDPVALWGLCAHRHMPLENTEVQNGSVVCPYHGYAYGADGRCHTIPTGGTPSPHARLRRYPVVERGPFVWIWMGNPDEPDLSLLPDPREIGLGDEQSDWKVDFGTPMLMKARAALLVDNLFDLSHLAFIHAESIPGGAGLVMIPPVFDTAYERLRVTRAIPGVTFEAGSTLDTVMPVAREMGRVYLETYTEYYGPGLINVSSPTIYVLTEEGAKGAYIASANYVHGITPETENTTHYFAVVTRDYCIDDIGVSAYMVDQADMVRLEDIAVLESIEQFVDDFASTRTEISSKIDEGAIKARRILKKLIQDEKSDTKAVGE